MDLLFARPVRNQDKVLRRALKLSDRVVVRDDVTDADLGVWYRDAKVFVFPSLTEGFGYPPLEAMRRGVTVVASNPGAMPEVLGDAAMLHDPIGVEALRELVSDVAENDAHRAELISAGRRRVARFTRGSSADQMESILRNVVRQRGS